MLLLVKTRKHSHIANECYTEIPVMKLIGATATALVGSEHTGPKRRLWLRPRTAVMTRHWHPRPASKRNCDIWLALGYCPETEEQACLLRKALRDDAAQRLAVIHPRKTGQDAKRVESEKQRKAERARYAKSTKPQRWSVRKAANRKREVYKEGQEEEDCDSDLEEASSEEESEEKQESVVPPARAPMLSSLLDGVQPMKMKGTAKGFVIVDPKVVVLDAETGSDAGLDDWEDVATCIVTDNRVHAADRV
ncbi:hypothetical protein OE88DRAFT_537780 [Heliocybe sulcata]|uniref:Uncharacterized protein n=1 Tax=Heliocybe sulcata TaxID=5364 RepID=A0A5C3MSR1_9AGAM|nr:hypothetical protein OE88DRAFT_537780 [Heliocybe sulcata]